MFDIRIAENGEIFLSGRFDAAQAERAQAVFSKIEKSCIVNFKDLEYISSAGLGELLMAQKRLDRAGESLKLVNLNKYIRDVFRYAGFDTIFEIE